MDYKPSFPARLVEFSAFKRADRPEFRACDPRNPAAWGRSVEINLSLQNQWLRNESWYWEALEHQVLRGEYPNLFAYFWQPEYPPYDPNPGYVLKQPLGTSQIMNTEGIE